MTLKAALALSIALMPAAALAEGHANVKHVFNLQRCHHLTADELMRWGRACPAIAKVLGETSDGQGIGAGGFAAGASTLSGIAEFGDLGDNKNELPQRGTSHAQAAPKGSVAPATGQISGTYAAQLGTISAHMIGAVTAATLNNTRITRANQAAYAAAHPAPAPAPAAAPPAHTATPPSAPAAPPSKAPPAAPPSKPSAPPAPPSKSSPPAPPPSHPAPPPSHPTPPSCPPGKPTPPSKPNPPTPPSKPNPPPSHPGKPGNPGKGPGKGGQSGCSGRGGGGHK